MKALLRTLLEPIRKNGVFDVTGALRRGRIIDIEVGGQKVSWLITNSNDEIQSQQIKKGFYELSELQQLRDDVGNRQSVLDVGSNIGNHSVYFMQRMSCRQIIAVEPNLPAARHFLANIALNQSCSIDLDLRGVGLGAKNGLAEIVDAPRFNLGMAQVKVGVGDVVIVRGDELTQDRRIDLIKIDVEGMEVGVLAGLEATIARDKPAIYVEVNSDTAEPVIAFLASHGYGLLRQTTAYSTQANLTLVAR